MTTRWSERVVVVGGLLAGLIVALSPVASAAPAVQVSPTSGPGGTAVKVSGSGYNPICAIMIDFYDSGGTVTRLGLFGGKPSNFQVQVVIPSSAATGTGTVVVWQDAKLVLSHCITSTVVSAGAQFTVAPQLLGNPGFENGSSNPAPWVTTGRINDTSTEPAHSGSWDAWLGGTGTTHQDHLYQDVAIPSGITSATLSFWLHIDTADTGSAAHDLSRLQVRNTSNAVLATLATYSNLNAAAGFAQKTFDLTAYAGQTIRMWLGSKEDTALQTSFVVDDFALTTA